MLSLVVATVLAAAGPPRVAVAAPSALGFEDAELPVIQARVRAVVANTGALVVDVEAVDPDCLEDVACVAARVGENDAIVVVDVSRVGSDVDVTDGAWGRDGASLAHAQRALSTTAFQSTPLSPEVTVALAGLVPHAAPAPSEQASASAPSLTLPSLAPSTLAVGAGVVLSVASLVGFALEAGTLDDPRSLGSDKERARVTAWVLLGGVAAGTGLAIAGNALLPHEIASPPGS